MNQQSITQATYEKDKTSCTSDDNTEKAHNNLSWFIWFTTHGLGHNSWTFRTIQADRAFLEKRKLK